MSRLKNWLVVDADADAQAALDNRDLRPIPDGQRTWGFWTYTYFWFSAAATIANWFSPAAFIAAGLSTWEAIGCHTAGQFIAGVNMVFSGRGGAVYHVGFPVLARSSFGVYGAFWPVINRAAMSIIWNGINLVQAGQCIYVMLRAIAPGIEHLHNVMSPGDAINSGGLIGLMIAWLLVMGICFISIPRLKVLLHVKLIVFIVSSAAMLGWTISTSGMKAISHRQMEVHHSPEKKAWRIIRFTILSWANCSTFIVNASDFQRYAQSPRDVILGQVIGFPVGNFLIGMVGAFVAQTSVSRFGHVVWNPVVYLDRIIEQDPSAANRAGCFFMALMFAFSALLSCLYENILPAGNDIAALWPKYLNIRRGFLICATLSLACVPWKLLNTSVHFIGWLSAYQVFLSAIIGIMMCHYYVIARGFLDVTKDLFRAKGSVYYYTKGINWRAYIAYIMGIAPNFYGFLGILGAPIGRGAVRGYYFSFPIGIITSALVFWALCFAFPPADEQHVWQEPESVLIGDRDHATPISPAGKEIASHLVATPIGEEIVEQYVWQEPKSVPLCDQDTMHRRLEKR
ncbi:allantoin permease [Trichomonascus vanleenenianus]|uniref:allantoin permease n=1 Tax=Trichomonascus vanleenenianus TaxID=2268995 RepID=UPI003EC9B769